MFFPLKNSRQSTAEKPDLGTEIIRSGEEITLNSSEGEKNNLWLETTDAPITVTCELTVHGRFDMKTTENLIMLEGLSYKVGRGLSATTCNAPITLSNINTPMIECETEGENAPIYVDASLCPSDVQVDIYAENNNITLILVRNNILSEDAMTHAAFYTAILLYR